MSEEEKIVGLLKTELEYSKIMEDNITSINTRYLEIALNLIDNQQKEIENLKSFICKIRNELKGNIITFDGKDYAPAKNLTKQEVYESYVKLITLLKSNYVFKENEDFIKELLEE